MASGWNRTALMAANGSFGAAAVNAPSTVTPLLCSFSSKPVVLIPPCDQPARKTCDGVIVRVVR